MKRRAKTSLKDRIIHHLRRIYPEWVNGGQIEKLAFEAGYKGSNASRRCREMESGKLSDTKPCPIVLEKKEEGGTVWYRALPPKRVTSYEIKELGLKLKENIYEN